MTTSDAGTTRQPGPARSAFQFAAAMFIAAVIAAVPAYVLYLQSGQPLLGALALALAVFGTAAGVSAWLGWAGRPAGSALVLIGGSILLFPVVAAIIADLGLLLGPTLAVGTALIAGLTLPRRPARLVILAGVGAGIVALLIDLFIDPLAPWQRIQLPAAIQDVYLPGAAFGLAALFGVLVAQQFPNYRLSTKLLIGFLTVALVPLTLISIRNDQETRAALRATANQSLLAGAAQTTATLDAFINANLTTTASEGHLTALSDYLRLAREARAGSDLERQVKNLLDSLQSKPLPGISAAQETHVIQAYYLLDAQGDIALSTAPEVKASDFLTWDLFKVPWNTGRAYVSPVYFFGAEQGSLYFSAPVLDAEEQTVGVLVSQVNVAWLQRIVAQSNNLLGPASASFAAIFDDHTLRLADGAAQGTNAPRFALFPDAATLAALDMQHRLPGLTAASLDARLPLLAKSVQSTQSVPSAAAPAYFTGVVHYAANPSRPEPVHLAALMPLTSQPWVVMFAQPEAVALAPARAQTRTTILLALVFAVGVAAVSVLAARTLAQPIGHLTWAAERVRAGDLQVRAVQLSRDEIGQLTETFNAMTAQLQQTLDELEQRVGQRTAQLQATADISRATAGIRDLGDLLELAVEMIRGRFGFYHASVFLIDEAGEYAILRESTGEIGAQLKARGHRLAIGSRSLVGWVTQNRKLRVARDVAGDPFHFKNPLLPETRSELCIPLLVGDRLLGALDVQSRELDAFSETDQQALQVLADQLSVAIQNAELFRQTQSALAEARALYQQTLDASWREARFAQSREMQFDLEPGLALSQPDQGPATARPIEIPLRLRDRTIGVIELYGRRGEGLLAPEEYAVLETVATQLATALESAALLQESQARSRRDQLITAISDEMRASLNPTGILQSSIRQLGRLLGATEVVVKLGPAARDEPASTRSAR